MGQSQVKFPKHIHRLLPRCLSTALRVSQVALLLQSARWPPALCWWTCMITEIRKAAAESAHHANATAITVKHISAWMCGLMLAKSCCMIWPQERLLLSDVTQVTVWRAVAFPICWEATGRSTVLSRGIVCCYIFAGVLQEVTTSSSLQAAGEIPKCQNLVNKNILASATDTHVLEWRTYNIYCTWHNSKLHIMA